MTRTDRRPAGLITFLHIPKTGGISFRRMLKSRILLENLSSVFSRHTLLGYYDIPSYEERLTYVQNLEPAHQDMILYFEGHYGYGVHEVLNRPCRYLTLLREPIERAVSNYYHLQRPGVRQRDGVPEAPLAEFFLMGKAWRGTTFFLDNCQVRYLAGENGKPLSVPFGEVTESDLAIAINRISTEFEFVGLTDRFDESSVLLQKALGWHQTYYVKTNVNPNRRPTSDLNADEITLVTGHNQLDVELYRFAVDRFERAIEEAGDDFVGRLSSFRRTNSVLASLRRPLGLGGSSDRRQKGK